MGVDFVGARFMGTEEELGGAMLRQVSYPWLILTFVGRACAEWV